MISKGRDGHPGGQAGSMTVELVLLAPVVVLFAMVAVGLGRVEQARQELVDAAHAGAEAASVASPGQAPVVAANVAWPVVAQQSHVCDNPSVATDTSTFGPPGRVEVTVACRVALSDLLIPGMPGFISLQATQSAPVDPYRAVP
jgi:hypothetical protein